MAILFYLILTLHVVACLFLIAVVLLQQGKGQDLASAFGGGGTQTAFGPRGSATVLSRATTILAGVFMVTSLALSIIRPRSSGILDQVPAATATPAPAATVAPAPVVPATSAPAVPATSAPAEAPAPTPAATPAPKK
jgi:preprotein translocase subunit SecG